MVTPEAPEKSLDEPTSLLLGPTLRHVGETTAVIWVQTDRPAEVSVLGCTARTFQVQEHHFALVTVTGLAPDSTTEYEVHIDGELMWPLPDSPFPPSVIRTRGPVNTERLRAVFGSCRYPKTGVEEIDEKLGPDALDRYADRMARLPVSQWPDLLILLGDQVYADELTPEARRHLTGRRRRRRKHGQRPPDEVVSFGEYEGLYRHSWSDPEIRWIMSTVPTAMIFDDHDIRDDWNTSAAWRAEMDKQPWWRDRIRAGLASYWVYQHMGNLSPAELAADEDYQRMCEVEGDVWPVLVEMADRADAEVDANKGVRFSYRWDFGRNRFIMMDTRNGRILDSGERMMIGEREFAWLEAQAADGIEQVDHLVLGSSVPWLMPPALSDMQTVNEIAADRPGWRGVPAEKLRQAADLEHWPAFVKSFLRLTTMIRRAATHPDGPATVTVLSGDVHHSYAAKATLTGAGDDAATVHQLVCSPVHNYVPAYVKPAFKLGWSRRLAPIMRRWARRHGSPELTVSWTNTAGPVFGNTIATLMLSGRDAEVLFEQPDASSELREVARIPLGGRRPTVSPVAR
ncbi:alkaline phosphatase D family protein [Mycolicibacterium litorale]|uniref:alkaline phosphatase D family protein n=1 Tax=Mycolicibacterium litorale TaxID=758802 RepID=UPI003CED6CA8